MNEHSSYLSLVLRSTLTEYFLAPTISALTLVSNIVCTHKYFISSSCAMSGAFVIMTLHAVYHLVVSRLVSLAGLSHVIMTLHPYFIICLPLALTLVSNIVCTHKYFISSSCAMSGSICDHDPPRSSIICSC